MAVTGPQTIAGRYAIYDRIASGGMASVHFGRMVGAVGFARTVAIKRLHPHLARNPEFVAAMIDEARLAARIRHPNVVPTLDVVAAEGELLVVMEYVRGESLARLLREERRNGGRVPHPIISAIVIGALRGLHAAHDATDDLGSPLGIVHRDVSPHNVLVGADGVARVIDFGVAKAAGRLQTTESGVLKGKMAYMAPEQIASEPVTRTADIYAMGVLLWEALAGRNLFEADSDARLVVMALDGAKEPPSKHAPDISEELDAFVMKALASKATDRFATAAEMAEALRQILPPAYETEVGAWVADVASVELAEQSEALGDIERRSGTGSLPPPASARALALRDVRASGERGMGTPTPFKMTSSFPERVSTIPMRPAVIHDPGARWRTTRIVRAVGALAASIIIAFDIRAVRARRAREVETMEAPTSSVTTTVPIERALPAISAASGSSAGDGGDAATATSARAAGSARPAAPAHKHSRHGH